MIRRKCRYVGGCNRFPMVGAKGMCWEHEDPENKKTRAQKKVIQRREKNQMRTLITPESFIQGWYKQRRYEMTGRCLECGGMSNKNNDQYFKWSICHIVPKSLVESVATCKDNWIELCNIHHQEFDSTFERAKKMKCFAEAKRKFQLFKHLIPSYELRKVNPYLND